MSKRFVLVVIALVTTGVAAAKWLLVGAPAPTVQVRVTEQSNQGVTFEVTVPGIEVSAERRDGRDFSRVTFPGGHAAPLTVGRPEVPMIPVLLAVPTGARVSVRPVSAETQELQVSPVLPLQPPVPIGHQPAVLVFDQAYYAQDEVYPATEAAVKLKAGWHDLGVASIHVYPVQVNPGRGTIRVASRMAVRVDFSGGAYPQTVTGWMIPMYSRLVANWPELDLPPADIDTAAHEYLAIVSATYWRNPALWNMLAWIAQRGYRVKTVQVAAPTRDTAYIKGWIQGEYYSHNGALRWVLLVGGPEEQIPVVRRPNPVPDREPHIPQRYGDFPYSDFDFDNFPEVGIGRICGQGMSYDDLTAIVGKIMRYQLDPKGPSASSPYSWLSTVQLVSHDGLPDPPCTYEDVELVRNLPLHFSDFDRFHIPGKDTSIHNQDVIDAVNAGAGLLFYYGHGGPPFWFSWANPDSWTAEQVGQLSNGNMTPVVLQHACDCGDITCATEDCITESWIGKHEGGAVAAMGSTGWMYSDESIADWYFFFAIGDYDSSVTHGDRTYSDPRVNLGDIRMLMNARQACNGEAGFLLISELLLGDPSMPVWTGGAPKKPLVTYQHMIPDTTPYSVSVSVVVDSVPVCSALVCLSQPDSGNDPPVEVLDWARTDSAGIAVLVVPDGAQGDFNVTVTEGHVNENVHQPGVTRTPILPFTSGTWSECAQVPAGLKPVKDGGWLAYNVGNGRIYAAKGNKQTDFYAYDPALNKWSGQPPMPDLAPIPPGREGKPPSKGCVGCADGSDNIYMTKVKNTLGFW